jgi:hypothetical protein
VVFSTLLRASEAVPAWLPLRIERAYPMLCEAVDIGTVIAYKYGDRPRGNPKEGEKTMASKKKANKKLNKPKSMQHTKPLSNPGTHIATGQLIVR